MTIIIGLIDAKKDCVWLGGDSLGSNGYTKAVESQPKVFKHDVFKNVVMGSTSTFRHINLLRYSENLFNELDWYKKETIDHKYLVTKFIPNLMNLFQNNIVSEKVEDRGANFIIGANNKLFEVQRDYSVLEPSLGFTAVGCGEAVAMGSLVTTMTMDLSPKERIKLALEACETYSCGVQRPFKIINTVDDDTIIIE